MADALARISRARHALMLAALKHDRIDCTGVVVVGAEDVKLGSR
jgi:hypothetical protein